MNRKEKGINKYKCNHMVPREKIDRKALITLWAGYCPMVDRKVSKRGEDGAQCSSWQRQKAPTATFHLPQNLWRGGDIEGLVATPLRAVPE